MPLNYEIKKRTFGFDETKTEKYVASAKRGHTVSYEDILKEVAKQSHLNSGEVYTAIEALIDVSITFMQQGRTPAASAGKKFCSVPANAWPSSSRTCLSLP